MLYEQDSRWPSQREELRATLTMLDNRWRDGDKLLVHVHALPAYRYYRELRPELWDQSLPEPIAIFSDAGEPGDLLDWSNSGEPARVWIVVSGVASGSYRDSAAGLAALDEIGEHISASHAEGAVVQLYALGKSVTSGGSSGQAPLSPTQLRKHHDSP